MVDIGEDKAVLPPLSGLDDPDRGSSTTRLDIGILGGETTEGCLDKIGGARVSDGG